MTMNAAQASAALAGVNAYQLAAIEPFLAALQVVQAAQATALADMAGVSNGRPYQMIVNAGANLNSFIVEAEQVVQQLTPPPTAAATSANIAYQTAGQIDLSSEVANAGSIQLAAPPAHGTVTVAGMVVTYTPAAAYSGQDSFSYSAVGAFGQTAPAVVSLTVAAAS